jgi:hypothetical protein
LQSGEQGITPSPYKPNGKTGGTQSTTGRKWETRFEKSRCTFCTLEIGVWQTKRRTKHLGATWQTGHHKTPRHRPAPPIAHRAAPVETPPAATRHATVIYLHNGGQGTMASACEPPSKTGRHKTLQGTVKRHWSQLGKHDVSKHVTARRHTAPSRLGSGEQGAAASSCESPDRAPRREPPGANGKTRLA